MEKVSTLLRRKITKNIHLFKKTSDFFSILFLGANFAYGFQQPQGVAQAVKQHKIITANK
jgi:nitrate reductase gamma subunit